jgi:hypothetical protein
VLHAAFLEGPQPRTPSATYVDDTAWPQQVVDQRRNHPGRLKCGGVPPVEKLVIIKLTFSAGWHDLIFDLDDNLKSAVSSDSL